MHNRKQQMSPELKSCSQGNTQFLMSSIFCLTYISDWYFQMVKCIWPEEFLIILLWLSFTLKRINYGFMFAASSLNKQYNFSLFYKPDTHRRSSKIILVLNISQAQCDNVLLGTHVTLYSRSCMNGWLNVETESRQTDPTDKYKCTLSFGPSKLKVLMYLLLELAVEKM